MVVASINAALKPQRPATGKASAAGPSRPINGGIARKDGGQHHQQLNQAYMVDPVFVAPGTGNGGGGIQQHQHRHLVGAEFDVPKDRLVADLREAKTSNRVLTDQLTQARVEIKNLRNELKEQDERIETLHITHQAHPAAAPNSTYGIIINQTRKAIEKTQIVRSIKAQCRELRSQLEEAQKNEKKMARDSKVHNVLMIQAERDEYLHECTRLRSLLEAVILELIKVKKGAEMNGNIVFNNNNDNQPQIDSLAKTVMELVDEGITTHRAETQNGGKNKDDFPTNSPTSAKFRAMSAGHGNRSSPAPNSHVHGSPGVVHSTTGAASSLTGYSPSVPPRAGTAGASGSALAVAHYADIRRQSILAATSAKNKNMILYKNAPTNEAIDAAHKRGPAIQPPVAASMKKGGAVKINSNAQETPFPGDSEVNLAPFGNSALYSSMEQLQVSPEGTDKESRFGNGTGISLEDWGKDMPLLSLEGSDKSSGRPGTSQAGRRANKQSNMGNIGATSLHDRDDNTTNQVLLGISDQHTNPFVLNTHEQLQSSPVHDINDISPRSIKTKTSKTNKKKKKISKKIKSKKVVVEIQTEDINTKTAPAPPVTQKTLPSTKKAVIVKAVPVKSLITGKPVKSPTSKRPTSGRSQTTVKTDASAGYADDFEEEGSIKVENIGHHHSTPAEAISAITPPKKSTPNSPSISRPGSRGRHVPDVTILHSEDLDIKHIKQNAKEHELQELENKSTRKTYICGNNSHAIEGIDHITINKGDQVEAVYNEEGMWFPGMCVSIQEEEKKGSKTTVEKYEVHFSHGSVVWLPREQVRLFKPSTIVRTNVVQNEVEKKKNTLKDTREKDAVTRKQDNDTKAAQFQEELLAKSERMKNENKTKLLLKPEVMKEEHTNTPVAITVGETGETDDYEADADFESPMSSPDGLASKGESSVKNDMLQPASAPSPSPAPASVEANANTEVSPVSPVSPTEPTGRKSGRRMSSSMMAKLQAPPRPVQVVEAELKTAEQEKKELKMQVKIWTRAFVEKHLREPTPVDKQTPEAQVCVDYARKVQDIMVLEHEYEKSKTMATLLAAQSGEPVAEKSTKHKHHHHHHHHHHGENSDKKNHTHKSEHQNDVNGVESLKTNLTLSPEVSPGNSQPTSPILITTTTDSTKIDPLKNFLDLLSDSDNEGDIGDFNGNIIEGAGILDAGHHIADVATTSTNNVGNKPEKEDDGRYSDDDFEA